MGQKVNPISNRLVEVVDRADNTVNSYGVADNFCNIF